MSDRYMPGVRTAIYAGNGRILLDVRDEAHPHGILLDAGAVQSILMEIRARAPELWSAGTVP